jgi:hypothetical protein
MFKVSIELKNCVDFFLGQFPCLGVLRIWFLTKYLHKLLMSMRTKNWNLQKIEKKVSSIHSSN